MLDFPHNRHLRRFPTKIQEGTKFLRISLDVDTSHYKY